jgi:two-component system, LytTR family, sensor kinase
VATSDGPGRLAELDEARRPDWKVWAAILGGWTLLSLLLAPEVYLNFLGAGAPIGWGRIVAITLTNTALAVAFTPGILWLTRRFPLEREHWLGSFAVHSLACLVFSLSHPAVYWLLCYASDGVLGLLLFQRVHPNILTYWAIVGFTEALRHFHSARRRERQLAEARLALLRAQLQPHFLFNTLNTIAAMMHEDVAAADRMVNRLSDLLRLALDGASAHETTLDRELHFAQSYVEIHRARFGEGLDLQLDIQPGLRGALVPSLVLQPLVENAIRHGFSSTPARGKLRIEATGADGRLQLRVVDDGLGLGSGEATGRGMGLENVRQRLEQLYPGAYRFSLDANEAGGAVATLVMPLAMAASSR